MKNEINSLNKALKIRDNINTADLIAKARVGQEGQEGITAFFEKRKPNWNK